VFSREGVIESYIKPDVVIVENGIGDPKYNLEDFIEAKEYGDITRVNTDHKGVCSSNFKFSLLQNDSQSSLYAAGSCTSFPSFFHKYKIRTDDVKFNIESGFFAALTMLDKDVRLEYIPMKQLVIGDKKVYFVGERCQPFTEIIINEDCPPGKMVAFYVYGNEICGFVTYGYTNLHLYLHEAMKQMVMPSAEMMRK